jgi:hypothetical protein
LSLYEMLVSIKYYKVNEKFNVSDSERTKD